MIGQCSASRRDKVSRTHDCKTDCTRFHSFSLYLYLTNDIHHENRDKT